LLLAKAVIKTTPTGLSANQQAEIILYFDSFTCHINEIKRFYGNDYQIVLR
jgi:hypothetical protein